MLTGSNLRIALLNGGQLTLQLPHQGDDHSAAVDQFKKIGSIVGAELRRRRKLEVEPKAERPSLKPNPWLKTICYRVIVEFIRQDHLEVFDVTLDEFNRYAKRQFPGLNIFQKGLMAIFAHDPKLCGIL